MVMQTDLNMLAISVSSSGVCGKVIHCLDQPPLNPCQKPNVAWHKPPVALIKHSNLQIKFERNIFFSLKKKEKRMAYLALSVCQVKHQAILLYLH